MAGGLLPAIFFVCRAGLTLMSESYGNPAIRRSCWDRHGKIPLVNRGLRTACRICAGVPVSRRFISVFLQSCPCSSRG